MIFTVYVSCLPLLADPDDPRDIQLFKHVSLQVWFGHSPISFSHVREFIWSLQHLPTATGLQLDIFFIVSALSSTMRLPVIP